MSKSFKSLAADPSSPVKKTDLWRVDPRIIHEQEGFNLRDYEDPDVIEHIEGFAKSYAEGIYVPPLMLRVGDDDKIYVVEGHCRRRGAMLAIERGVELQFVDAVSFKGNDVERVEVMLRSAEGLKLKPLKIAQGYLRLVRLGFTTIDIAQRMNKSRQHVDQMLMLANANHDVHQLVNSGIVPAHVAIESIRQHGESAGEFLSEKAAEVKQAGKKTVTQATVKGWAPSRKIATALFNGVDAMVKALPNETRIKLAEIEKLGEEEIKGKKVEIDASILLDMLSAYATASQKKTSQEQSPESGTQSAIDYGPQGGNQ